MTKPLKRRRLARRPAKLPPSRSKAERSFGFKRIAALLFAGVTMWALGLWAMDRQAVRERQSALEEAQAILQAKASAELSSLRALQRSDAHAKPPVDTPWALAPVSLAAASQPRK
ncbi:hypothetical protein [Phenylobacterium aquaticum]|uniref:hypothetical protein n=1 Tax=Phenylobacterium aquaticum TaxID=1763816 RepID=UPI001F5CBB8E|nr:hypothetical protein [Phenylobacterium aquaticum]MCI3135335.1 hypothetical protein [Phenylobacterium aquaticum]